MLLNNKYICVEKEQIVPILNVLFSFGYKFANNSDQNNKIRDILYEKGEKIYLFSNSDKVLNWNYTNCYEYEELDITHLLRGHKLKRILNESNRN